jgi:threonine synthase
MEPVTGLGCTLCSETYAPDQVVYTCQNHDGVAGMLEVTYDYDAIYDRFDASVDGKIPYEWKYHALLPVHDETNPVTLTGWRGTELYEAPRHPLNSGSKR